MDKAAAKKKFIKYFAAAVFSALASCIYSLGDTIIIGQYEGELGIKALNLVLPLYMLFYALGLLFGMGAGIMVSYLRGKNQNADGIFSVSFFALTGIMVLFSVFSEIYFAEIMNFLGADAQTMPYLESYGRYVTRGALSFAICPFLNSVMRNDNAPVLVSAGIVVSCLLNVLLDYVFVFLCDMGMAGAGLATLVCYSGQLLVTATHLMSKKCSIALTLKGLKLKDLFIAAKGGFASFIAEFSGGVFMVIMNRQLLVYIPAGVEIYAIVANLVLVANGILNGASVAAQPIVSAAFGAKMHDEVDYYKKIGLSTVAVLAVVIYVAVASYPRIYAYAFSSSPSSELLQGVSIAVRLYMTSVFFYGFSLFYISFFQAILKDRLASALNFLRGILFSSILAFVLPLITPQAIWLAVPLGEALTLMIIFVYILKSKKNTQSMRKIA